MVESGQGSKVDAKPIVHALWGSVASSWADHADYIDDQARPVTEALIKAASLAPGDRVLELASGPGGLGLAAAELVAPGEVVISDVVGEMVDAAARRAQGRGLTNVSTAVLDLEEIALPDQSFDKVLSREGLMFAFDVGHAVSEMLRVLRPGGRAAVAVWGPPERNPWLSLVFRAVSETVGHPVPPPSIPGPFSLCDMEELNRYFVEAGFVDVDVQEHQVPRTAPAFEAWWSRTSQLAGPLSKILEGLSPEARTSISDRLRVLVEPYESDGGLAFPGVCIVASGSRAG